MKELDNLVTINKLKTEPADANEFLGMLRAGATKLKDLNLAEYEGHLDVNPQLLRESW